jgi:hypothetical protein
VRVGRGASVGVLQQALAGHQVGEAAQRLGARGRGQLHGRQRVQLRAVPGEEVVMRHALRRVPADGKTDRRAFAARSAAETPPVDAWTPGRIHRWVPGCMGRRLMAGPPGSRAGVDTDMRLLLARRH